ncbi:MAG TPA: O-antigen ligase family protein [Solirubrobacteraceae bacterium]|nr:O-antigen ligase family protein [Solirubrobacteraceae bacterium]
MWAQTSSTLTAGDRAQAPRNPAWLGRELTALVAGLPVVALMLVWAIHDGGYDTDTWYWGALVMLALLTGVVIARGARAVRIPRSARVALAAFALYVAWSYLSISWAQSPGDALEGSNRALLYLLVFSTMLVLPWTVRSALIALLTFAVGVGIVAIVLLVRLASADHVASLVISGRLAAPTGYFNSTAALFTIAALTAIALASRRELPGLLRGALIGFACAGLQLGVIVQSRGWLFTLPLIAIVTIVLLPDRLRVAAAAVIPVVAAVAPIHRLLHVYQSATPGPALNHSASLAGHSALLLCGLGFVVATLIAWGESVLPAPRPNPVRRRVLGTITIAVTVIAVGAGGVAATHGHPFRFIEHQWNGFSHPLTTATGSHFTDVGSGRYDFWRVALDAFVAHPIGGLGQDNFDNYYVSRRRTNEEPEWTHSLELRLLAHTGIVGFLLFGAFIVASIAAALRGRRRPGLAGFVAGAALLPLVVWLIHGSIDWFWEIPALSGPALGFLGMAGALGARPPADTLAAGDAVAEIRGVDADSVAGDGAPPRPPRPALRAAAFAAGALALLAAVVVLGFPYLSVREESGATNLRQSNPAQALHDLTIAADLNPLSADPGRIGGTIALDDQRYASAQQRFDQSISRDPGGWYAWLGAGLAASARGEKAVAQHDLRVAGSINRQEPVIRRALALLHTAHPLSPVAALAQLTLSL